jgi:cobalt-zinc-cadmium efflux system outer membrane protein
MFRLTPFVFLLVVFPFRAAIAQALDARQAIRLAFASHPDLLASAQDLAAARAVADLDTRWDAPELGLNHATDAMATDRGESVSGLSVSQSFPLGGRLARQRKLSAVDIAWAESETDILRHDLARVVRLQMHDLRVLDEGLALRERFLALQRESLAWLDEQARRGEAPALEANALRLELLRMDQELKALRAARLPAQRALALTLGLAQNHDVVLADEPDHWETPADPWSLRPDLRQARLAVEIADARHALAAASRWGDLGVGLFAEREESGDGETVDLAGIALSVPLPLWDRRGAALREKDARREAAEIRLRGLLRRLEGEAEALRAERENLQDRLRDATETVLPHAMALLAETEAAHRQGLASLPEVLHARRTLLDLESHPLELRQALRENSLRHIHLHALDLAP